MPAALSSHQYSSGARQNSQKQIRITKQCMSKLITPNLMEIKVACLSCFLEFSVLTYYNQWILGPNILRRSQLQYQSLWKEVWSSEEILWLNMNQQEWIRISWNMPEYVNERSDPPLHRSVSALLHSYLRMWPLEDQMLEHLSPWSYTVSSWQLWNPNPSGKICKSQIGCFFPRDSGWTFRKYLTCHQPTIRWTTKSPGGEATVCRTSQVTS